MNHGRIDRTDCPDHSRSVWGSTESSPAAAFAAPARAGSAGAADSRPAHEASGPGKASAAAFEKSQPAAESFRETSRPSRSPAAASASDLGQGAAGYARPRGRPTSPLGNFRLRDRYVNP